MSNKKVLILALICGLLTAVALNFYLKSVKEAAENIKTRKVAVALTRIPARTLVTADMISLKNVPVDFIHQSAVTDTAQVVGNTTRAEIEAGEQILQTKLVPKENTGVNLAYSVPLGKRAVSVKVDEQSGVAGLLSPGDRVDVMGTIEGEIYNPNPDIPPIKATKTHLILQNIEVLAVGRNYKASDLQQDNKNSQNQSVSTVTLAVPSDKMQFLVAVIDKGKITLALRSAADKSEEDRPPMDAMQLIR